MKLRNFDNLKSRRGLTLIEIAVVVMIMGTLLAFSITSISSFLKPGVSDVSEKLKAALVYCQKSAIIHNQAVIFQIDIDNNRYSAVRIVRNDSGVSEKKILDVSLKNSGRIIDVVDIRGVKIDSGIVKIPFTYTGVSEDYSIHVGNEYTVLKTVLNYRYNGKVVIKEGSVVRKAKGNSMGDRQESDESL